MSLKSDWKVNGQKYHSQFLEKYQNIDFLDVSLSKTCRFFNMDVKDRKLKNQIFAQKRILKYIVLVDKINNKEVQISPTIRVTNTVIKWKIIIIKLQKNSMLDGNMSD